MDTILIANWLAILLSFFVAGCLLGALFSRPVREKLEAIVKKFARLKLTRGTRNPIMGPTPNLWEKEAVMNPAAVRIGGRTHLIYRAVGSDGISRLGYASSADGHAFDERLPYPAYMAAGPRPSPYRYYNPVLYPSGGSWGGCEDPRMVAIDGRVYVTFNMFDNWTLRVGCISIGENDFLAKRFQNWEGPITLSHGSRDKNWVLFPEKINGKFAVLHSIIGRTPNRVRVEYVIDLKNLRYSQFESPDPQQGKDTKIAWHIHVRSAGPPPIKTDRGWLVLYHANDHEGYKYKLGAMLLDLKDPEKVLYRSASPVLEPDFAYENEGKPGIVYACGAFVEDGTLYVYYGGGDRVACVATTPIKEFLDELIESATETHAPAPTLHPLMGSALAYA